MYIKKFMLAALAQARLAAKHDETPIGAVICLDGDIIARGRNKREKKQNCLCHAEIDAINKACKKLGSWRLSECDMYVTLEPCPMCAGAIIQARIKNLYFGAYDYKAGCAESKAALFAPGLFNHDVNVEGGHEEEAAKALLQDFFKKLRKAKKEAKE